MLTGVSKSGNLAIVGCAVIEGKLGLKGKSTDLVQR